MTVTPAATDTGIAGCPMIIEHTTGRRAYLAHGGRFYRLGETWAYHRNGQPHGTIVTVPETLAALETRDTQQEANR